MVVAVVGWGARATSARHGRTGKAAPVTQRHRPRLRGDEPVEPQAPYTAALLVDRDSASLVPKNEHLPWPRRP